MWSYVRRGGRLITSSSKITQPEAAPVQPAKVEQQVFLAKVIVGFPRRDQRSLRKWAMYFEPTENEGMTQAHAGPHVLYLEAPQEEKFCLHRGPLRELDMEDYSDVIWVFSIRVSCDMREIVNFAKAIMDSTKPANEDAWSSRDFVMEMIDNLDPHVVFRPGEQTFIRRQLMAHYTWMNEDPPLRKVKSKHSRPSLKFSPSKRTLRPKGSDAGFHKP